MLLARPGYQAAVVDVKAKGPPVWTAKLETLQLHRFAQHQM